MGGPTTVALSRALDARMLEAGTLVRDAARADARVRAVYLADATTLYAMVATGEVPADGHERAVKAFQEMKSTLALALREYGDNGQIPAALGLVNHVQKMLGDKIRGSSFSPLPEDVRLFDAELKILADRLRSSIRR